MSPVEPWGITVIGLPANLSLSYQPKKAVSFFNGSSNVIVSVATV